MTDEFGRAHKEMPCRHCGKPGVVGIDLMPYLVKDSKGADGHVWLHQETCSEPWHEKYRAWLASLVLQTQPAGATV